MYCSKCGAQNRDDAGKCVICGTPLVKPEEAQPEASGPTEAPKPPTTAPTVDSTPAAQPVSTEPAPPNYLVWAILSTLFCCWPTGIVAIVFAAQVSSKMQAGDVEGARKASGNAKLWTWITFGIGLAGILLGVIFGIIGAVAGNM
jgi:hypothetical protein